MVSSPIYSDRTCAGVPVRSHIRKYSTLRRTTLFPLSTFASRRLRELTCSCRERVTTLRTSKPHSPLISADPTPFITGDEKTKEVVLGTHRYPKIQGTADPPIPERPYEVSGWACSSEDGALPVEVMIYIDHHLITTIEARTPRDDGLLKENCNREAGVDGSVNVGFLAPIPALTPGTELSYPDPSPNKVAHEIAISELTRPCARGCAVREAQAAGICARLWQDGEVGAEWLTTLDNYGKETPCASGVGPPRQNDQREERADRNASRTSTGDVALDNITTISCTGAQRHAGSTPRPGLGAENRSRASQNGSGAGHYGHYAAHS
eukprot:1186776-Prorocentrum_minimum.AAC.2